MKRSWKLVALMLFVLIFVCGGNLLSLERQDSRGDPIKNESIFAQSIVQNPGCDWPSFGRTPDNNRVAPDGCGPKTDNLINIWEFGANGSVKYPVILDDKIYFGSSNGEFYCVDCTFGKKIWEYRADGKISSPSIIIDDKIYFGSEEGKFYCLDIKKGEKRWEYKVDGIIYAPNALNGRIYVRTNKGEIHCLDAQTGSFIWSYSMGSFTSYPALLEDKLYFCSYKESIFYCYCINSNTGKVIWEYQKEMEEQPYATAVVISNEKIYFGLGYYTLGLLYCLDIQTGEEKWSFRADSEILNSPIVSNGKVYFSSMHKTYCVYEKTGAKKWEIDVYNGSSYAIALSEGNLFLASMDGVQCLRISDGQKKWSYKSLFHPNYVLISSKRIYVVSENIVCCFGDFNKTNQPASNTCDWLSYGRTPDNNRVVPDGCAPKNNSLVEIWKTSTGSHPLAIATENKIYISLYDFIYCLDDKNGRVIWEYKCSKSVSSYMAIKNGRLYFDIRMSSKQHVFCCLDAQVGRKIWEYEIPDYTYDCISPIATDDGVYFGTSNGKIYCLSPQTGKLKWEYNTGGEINYMPAIADGKLYAASSNNLYCLDLKTGKKLWKYETYYITSSPVVCGEKIYVGSSYGSRFYCFDTRQCKVIWTIKINIPSDFSPVVYKGMVYVGSTDRFYCLNSSNGSTIWSYNTHDLSSIISSPILSAGRIYFANKIKIYSLDSKKGLKLWEYEIANASSLSISNGKLYINSITELERILYCFSDSPPMPPKGTCCDNCTDCNKCMAFKVGSKDWFICNQLQAPMSTAPIIKNGRTFLVIRYIAETIGANVDWNATSQTVTITDPKNGKTIQLQINNNIATIGGKKVQIDQNTDVKPFISEGRTLLPLRFVVDSLGLDLDWLDQTKEAAICYKDPICP